ncbi:MULTISPECIES: hypothetical protein [Arthrobacter]|uniref:hypothetical protein n=1 Tax=Arthrobacter TaxID=1663 RepID=UPI0006DAAD44|nr:hypothetical protein [Arthrobacter sp. Edens01]KPN19314.1 hypothetical protein AO716_05820 [Arthrobacter sp. Edens01]
MTTEPTGPANEAEDPLGPSAPQPEPTGAPRMPGQEQESAGNIREAQGTHAAGTVPPAHSGDDDEPGGQAQHPEDALNEPDSADG